MTTNHDDPQVSPITLTPLVPVAQLRHAERELSAAQTRVHELERELDLANAHAERLMKERDQAQARIAELENALDKTMTPAERIAQAQAGLVNLGITRLKYPHCSICGLVLDPNERECPRCEADAARDERTWFVGVQGGI